MHIGRGNKALVARRVDEAGQCGDPGRRLRGRGRRSSRTGSTEEGDQPHRKMIIRCGECTRLAAVPPAPTARKPAGSRRARRLGR